jgi:hypothetical protein
MAIIILEIFTRQYVADMTRARLEGLLDAFPKLVTSDKSKTNTDSHDQNYIHTHY